MNGGRSKLLLMMRPALDAVVLAILSAGNLLAWLAWDTAKDEHGQGPYAAWQVGGLVIVALGLLWWAVRRGGPLWVAAGLPIGLTVGFAWVASRSGEPRAGGDGLWVVGAFMVAAGSAIATWTVAKSFRRRQGVRGR